MEQLGQNEMYQKVLFMPLGFKLMQTDISKKKTNMLYYM